MYVKNIIGEISIDEISDTDTIVDVKVSREDFEKVNRLRNITTKFSDRVRLGDELKKKKPTVLLNLVLKKG